jgi:hypothetical protein
MFFVVVVQPAIASATASANASASSSVRASASASIPASAQASVGDDEKQVDGQIGKRLTSWVWQHFTRYEIDVEQPDGSSVKQKWAKCLRCSHKAKADASNGTKAFSNHLKLKHCLVKGQQQLSQSGNDIATYKYDEKASVRLLYYAIIMHEYPFIVAEHKYFMKFIKSLRPSFPFKSRITVRKEILRYVVCAFVINYVACCVSLLMLRRTCVKYPLSIIYLWNCELVDYT